MSESAKVYKPQGACLDILYCQDPVAVTVGPAGSGKSRAALTKLYLSAEKYPKSRHLIARQTRESCTDSVLVTWEDEVLPEGHPAIGRTRRENRHSYIFPNGSEVVCLGLDKPSKLFSTQWDLVYVNEAIEASEDTIDSFGRAMRNEKMPFSLLLLDTNPGPPTHWLKRWIDTNKVRHIPTTHKDNGRYYDEEKGEFTQSGINYLERLRQMTGARYDRLYLGQWSTPEGARWPNMDAQVHRFNAKQLWPRGIPEYYTKWISIDGGFGQPYCALWHCADRENNVYTYRCDYVAGLSADIIADRVVSLSPLNEEYYAEYLDPATWHHDAFSRGKMTHEISGATIYADRFGKERPRFGAVLPGTRVKRQMGFSTLDKMLNRDNQYPNWHISYDCQPLWDELIGAVLHKNQTTGVTTEDLDPKCPDHAITAAIYGLHTHFKMPNENKPPPFDRAVYEKAYQMAREEESERNFRENHEHPSIRF